MSAAGRQINQIKNIISTRYPFTTDGPPRQKWRITFLASPLASRVDAKEYRMMRASDTQNAFQNKVERGVAETRARASSTER